MGCGASQKNHPNVIEPSVLPEYSGERIDIRENEEEKRKEEEEKRKKEEEKRKKEEEKRKEEEEEEEKRKKEEENRKKQEKKKFKLTYFDLGGRGEFLRLIFAASNIDFIDERVDFKEWSIRKKNTQLEQLPYLEIDAHPPLYESMAIARYLAREMNLAGRNSLEKLKVDFVLDLCKELMDKYALDILPELIYPTDDKEEIIEDFLDNIVDYYFKKIEKLIETMGEDGYVVGNKLTVADLLIYDLINKISKLSRSFLDNFPRLKNISSNIEKNQNLKVYLGNRKESY